MVPVIPIGYPQGRFGPVTRWPAEELTYYDRWRNTATQSSTDSDVVDGAPLWSCFAALA